jgi:hypothetical protein
MNAYKKIFEFIACEIHNKSLLEHIDFNKNACLNFLNEKEIVNNCELYIKSFVEFEWSPIILIPKMNKMVTSLMCHVDMDIKNRHILNPIYKYFQQKYLDMHTWSSSVYSKLAQQNILSGTGVNSYTEKIRNCIDIIKKTNTSSWVFTTSLETALVCRTMRTKCILVETPELNNTHEKYKDFLHIVNHNTFNVFFDVSKYQEFKNEDKFNQITKKIKAQLLGVHKLYYKIFL